jgi:sodium transport system permease protein
MKIESTLAIYRKEMTDFLRDRRTIVSMILLPIFIMPVVMIGMNRYVDRQRREARAKRYSIAFRDPVQFPGLREAFEQAGFDLKESADPRQAVESKASEIGIEAEAGKVKIFSDSSQPELMIARSRVSQVLDTLRNKRVKEELERAGVPPEILSPFRVENVNVAPPRRMSAAILSNIFGFILVIFMISGGMYPAMDMTSGEKERRTMEMLLSSAASREDIVMGKLLAVTTLTFFNACLSVMSMGGTFYFMKISRGPDLMGGIVIEPITFVLILVAVIPMAIFTASLTLAIATPARSSREAASYLTPLVFAGMFLGMITILPGISLGWRGPLIPFANFCLLLKDLLSGDWSWKGYAITMCANVIYAAFAFAVAVRIFKSEEVLFRT